MKASRILAGMSAAAFAASLMSMVSVSAATEIVAADFGSQIYAMGSSNWNWYSVDNKFNEDGTITLVGNAEEIWQVSSHPEGKDPDTLIGGAGVQFYLGDAVKDLADNEYTTETIEYTITASGDETFKKEGTVEATLGKKGDDGKRVNTTEIAIAGYESDPAEWTKLGDLTVTATVKDITVVEEQAEPEYTLPFSTDETGEYGGWGSQAYVPSKVYQLVPEGKGATVTIDYKVLREPDANGGIYSLAKFANAQAGWNPIAQPGIQEKYDEACDDEGADSALAKGLEAQLWKQNSIPGFDREKTLSEDEVEKRKADKGAPSINDDGFFVFYYPDTYTDTGSLTFNLSPEAVADLASEDENGYGGSLFQVYNLDITSISIDAADVEPEEPVYEYNAFEMYTDNWTYQQMSQEDADARGMGFTVSAAQTTYTAESATAYYDADGNLQYGEVPEGTEAYKVAGATVWNVDIDGLADAVGAGTAGVKNDDGSDLSAADKMKLAQDAGIEISNVKLLIDGKEFYSIPDDKLLYGDIEGNGKIRLEVYNEYGETGNTQGEFFDKDRVEAIAAEANAGTHYAVTFDITGVPEKAPDPVDTYSFTPADGYATTYTGNTGDVIDLAVALKQNGAPVADENVDWVFSSEAYSVQTIGAGENEVVVLPTDKDGISAGQYKCGSEAEIITVTATLENAEDYGNVSPVVFTIYQNIPDSQEDSSNGDSSSSSSSSNTSSGGSSSSSSTTDNNPATGAAALGTVGILLAGAAMAVSKKKQ